MKKINLTIGALLLGSVLFASNFVACGGSDSNGTPGTAGTTGASGVTGTAGTGSPTDGGGAGTGAAPTDAGGAMLADGKCAPGSFRRDGLCTCQLTTPTFCGDACVDLQSDNDNCGTCGNKCKATSACAKGVCGPEATNVLPKITGCGELTIAVSGDKVYYADQTHGTIASVPAAGGAAATPLTGAQTEKLPTAIAVSGTDILWINNEPAGAGVDGGAAPVKSTLRRSAAGAAPVDVVTATAPGGGIRGFVVDGTNVYYSSGNFVKVIPVAGGTSKDIVNEEHGGIPGALAIEGTKLVYPTDGNGDVDVVTITNGVARCGKEDATKPGGYDMENCVRIARSQGSLRKQVVFAFGGWAYWIDSPSVKSGELVPPAGQAAMNAQVGATQNAIQGMATNKTNIYFSDLDSSMPGVATGMIWKTGINASQLDATQKPIARGQMAPSAVAVGATKVFWVADCAINSTGL